MGGSTLVPAESAGALISIVTPRCLKVRLSFSGSQFKTRFPVKKNLSFFRLNIFLDSLFCIAPK
ncbi:hypothetical protein COS81_04550 [candidate division WWE3 bacterium CG06_land_8_20_14_3_00_42_16]|uniref:Uncharacterized protein n=4 Tax=Katanobacteria TaxID=422282 RepID=A0A2M7ALP1_UNCKA|nr:MAG: hypothetical protein AUJ38_00560 [bacterium CG1_02_42_9]PIU68264.1 MAG: hypothetical protein COS81_04550 [candidate division WWE3 bacterium CG06_land_8_20_14_3_00_42_16]PIZ42103.1 MAG: hypothetical protein COY34_03460 [candidate division WWE3 bacterium CG_4_10_14_0_2_um_filter_42_8]PJA37879.1 MAG: hypothetical protein CO181_01745 [candidate division WWE3 bacterium CG_4_9_14_3_um_filter_43_9]PJC69397.1 MAG: hypothetical protein CO015_00375 [candidate division WWE3 bacterium CG_4_8_14_3_u